MKNPSRARSFLQCFICREWSWDVSRTLTWSDVELCLPCYVDILEVKQARGVMGAETRFTPGAQGNGAFTPESDGLPGNSPSPFVQGDLFE